MIERLQVAPAAVPVFEARRIGPAELAGRLQVIEKSLGTVVLSSVVARPLEEPGTAVQIIERSSILNAVKASAGFERVRRAITQDPNASLEHPEGEWLQLSVGALLARAGETVAFDAGSGAPADVSLRHGSIRVECKPFVLAPTLKTIWRAHLDAFRLLSAKLSPGSWFVDVTREWTARRDLGDLTDALARAARLSSSEPLRLTPDIIVGPAEGGRSHAGWDQAPVMQILGSFGRGALRIPFSGICEGAVSVLFQGPTLDPVAHFIDVARRRVKSWPGATTIVLGLPAEGPDAAATMAAALAPFLEEERAIAGLLLVSTCRSADASRLAGVFAPNPRALCPVPAPLAETLAGLAMAL